MLGLNKLGRLAKVVIIAIALAPFMPSPRPVKAQEPARARDAPLFDFHSNFWVNLHQVLFHEAKLGIYKPGSDMQGAPPLSAPAMTRGDKATWDAVVKFYIAHFSSRPQHGNKDIIDINDELARQPDDGERLSSNSLSPDIIAVLRRAAPIYRKYWWQAHDRSNKAWLDSQSGRLQKFGPKLAEAMTRDLHQTWPAAPIRVDMSYYVVALGSAFTTTNPSHTTLSSFNPYNQTLSGSNVGLSGFELLFHEASHDYADTLVNALVTEARLQHKNARDLWHAVLFYTSGVELRRLLPVSERKNFAPYGYRENVYRGHWAIYLPILETDWQSYLDGRTNFDTAIHTMVKDLPETQV